MLGVSVENRAKSVKKTSASGGAEAVLRAAASEIGPTRSLRSQFFARKARGKGFRPGPPA